MLTDDPNNTQLVASASVPKRTSNDSFRSRPACGIIEWHLIDKNVPCGRRTVPRAVARSFGTSERTFSGESALSEYLDHLIDQVAFDRIVAALQTRERSTTEIARKLKDEGFSDEQTNAAVARAQRCRLIDDLRFAEVFINSKMYAGWGRSRIERELKRAGIDPTSIPDYPDRFFTPDSEYERAQALLARRTLSAKDPVNKFARYLIGKGFDVSLSFRLARAEVERRQAISSDSSLNDDI